MKIDEENSDENPEVTDEMNGIFDEIDQNPISDDIVEDEDSPSDEDIIEDDTDDKSDEEESDDKDQEDEEKKVQVLDEWVEAGGQLGMSEAEVRQIAQTNPGALAAMTARLVASSHQEAEPAQDEEEEEEIKSLDHVEFEVPKDMDPGTKAVFEQFAKQNNLLIDQLNNANERLGEFGKSEAGRQAENQSNVDHHIDTFFDEQVKECPDLGVDASLTPAQLEVRKQVYEMATVIPGQSLDDKLSKAVQAYNGMNGKAEKQLKKKLNKQKQRFSPRPNNHKRNKKFKNDDAAAENKMNEIMDEMEI